MLTRLERALGLPKGSLFDAAGRTDATARTFLNKRQARPLMRTFGRLSAEDLDKVLSMAEELAKKHHPEDL